MVLVLGNRTARAAACVKIYAAPDGYVCRIGPPRKSRDQEEKYHAMIGDIAKQFKFCNRLWDTEDMKRLLIDQFRRETINDPAFKELWAKVAKVELAPSLDGSGTVALGVQSRRFPKELASGFITWLSAWGADMGIRWSAREFTSAPAMTLHDR